MDPPFIYHFPSEWQEFSGLVYSEPGALEIKLEYETPSFGEKISKPADIFYIDKLNTHAKTRFLELQKKYQNIQSVRYANSMMETIKRCANRSSTGKFWVISSENIYTDFDFAWHPNSWQGYMTHVFGSSAQKWADTYLINKHEFLRSAKWAKEVTELPNLNFVSDAKVVIPSDKYDVYLIDHGVGNETLEQVHAKGIKPLS